MLLQVAETTRTRFSALVGQRAGLTSAFAPFLVAQIRDLPQLNQNTPTYRIRRSKLSNLRRTGVRWQSPFSSVHSSCTLPFDIFTPCATWHRIQRTVSVRSVSNSTENSPHLPDPGRGQPRPVVPPRRRVLSFGPFIIITAVTTAAFFRRQRSTRPFSDLKNMSIDDPSPGRIDSHLHVWAAPEEADAFPYFPGQEPPLLGSAAFLLERMRVANVDGALIVQPINHKFDHSYVASMLKNFPRNFVGCLLADPTDGGGGVVELERLVKQEGFHAVRFNPYLWPDGRKMNDETGKKMFQRAGELNCPVGFMCFKGLLLHLSDIEALCTEFPGTKVMMDHFGFCKPPTNEEEELAWTSLLALSRFPQVFVKTSAFFRISRENFPYKDTWPLVRQLVDAFGAERIMWGSDFPYIEEQCGYEKSWEILPQLAIEDEVLSSAEQSWVFGGTVRSLFPGAWDTFV